VHKLKYSKYSELIIVLLIAEQQNEVLMNDHSKWPTIFTVVPEAHADVGEISHNRKGGHRKGKWEGERGAFLKGLDG
jgi:hypothetical protein